MDSNDKGQSESKDVKKVKRISNVETTKTFKWEALQEETGEDLDRPDEMEKKKLPISTTNTEKTPKRTARKMSRKQSGSSMWSTSTGDTKQTPQNPGGSHLTETMSVVSGSSGTTSDATSRILNHGIKGEWSQVELIVRYCQKGDPEIFAIDDVSLMTYQCLRFFESEKRLK